ncbi:TIGR03619 family F420-dependent LLM class oxidoreductase [Thermocatellispora tengchongensis]|uniref:TIGR03619 family F420-dependent LLM class oxidoreductase n=1 Tax=Thermocatellispora tengchongensis TaxID=1073253 RepID=UPI0016217434|nr:TIGR03619 family F420-dependent LLM class oxidoreductase [Thermocatellispora tengchongensis]
MKLGVPLGLLHPAAWKDVAVAADELGYESVWLPEHLVFATDLSLAAYPSTGKPAITPHTPLFDAPAYLCWLAAHTTRIKLGTAVYLFALRHPFTAARAFATLDTLSEGRALCGVGAGWYEAEWRAAGLDFATRGPRLDEAIQIARRLWTEPAVAHEGRFYAFPEVAFEPKPVQRPLPVLAGGDSPAALRRATRLCDGWISMPHTPDTIRRPLATLARLNPPPGFSITVHAYDVKTPADLAPWTALGIDRLIIRPWHGTRDAVSSLTRFAEALPPP